MGQFSKWCWDNRIPNSPTDKLNFILDVLIQSYLKPSQFRLNSKFVKGKVLTLTHSYLQKNIGEYPFFFFKFTLFIYFWLHWVFVAVRRLSLVVASGGYSLLQCAGFSLQWLLLLRSTGSRREGFSSFGAWALERRLSSCSARAQLLYSMWDLPGSGLEPMSPALAGGFLTTAPPGKPGEYL